MADFKKVGSGSKRFVAAGGKPRFEGARGQKTNYPKKNWVDKGAGDRPTTLHKARCSSCGNECEVPFRPVNGKPVFCRNCFVKTGDTARGRAGDRFPKRDYGASGALRAKPYDAAPRNDGVIQQLEAMNTKLERIMSMIESMKSAPSSEKNDGQKSATVAAVKKISTRKIAKE